MTLFRPRLLVIAAVAAAVLFVWIMSIQAPQGQRLYCGSIPVSIARNFTQEQLDANAACVNGQVRTGG